MATLFVLPKLKKANSTGVAHSNPDSSSDSRRGRGRGTRRSQLPTTSHADEQSEEHEFREDEDPEFLNEDHEDDTLVEGDDRSDMDKIKQIQQQKMMIVTPMAQKRTRGRPPRQRTSSQAQMPDDLMDEELMSQDLLESGPLEGPGSSDRKPAPPVLVGRGSRARNAPKKLNDFVQHHQLANKKMQIQEISIPLPLAPNAGIEDNIEPLIPNDAHIEEVRHEVVEKDVVKSVIERDRDEDQEQEHASVADPAGPPPAPAHLANKANSRGRPANPIPPHRRPVPKDLVPPGFPSLKRASSQRDPTPIKRKDTREVAEKVQESHRDPEPNDAPPSPLSMSEVPIAAHQVEIEDEVVQSGSPIDIVTEVESNDGPPPMPPMLLQQQSSQASSSTVPSASQGVTVPSTALDATKKKEREAGKDLPSEHFPKEKARHVSTRGLHPYVSDKSHIYDVRDQVLIHPEDMEQQEQDAIAQQRVLTLQGGNFIEDRIGRSDLMEDEEMKMMKSIQPQQYIVEENGMNVVYEVDPNSVIEEEEQVEIQAAEQQAEQYVMDEHSKQGEMEDEEDDDLPPQLVPEGVPEDAVGDDERDEQSQEKGLAVDEDGNFDFNMMDEGEMIRLQSPGGRAHEVRFARDVHGNSVFIDENGHIVELVTDTGALVEPHNMVEQEQQVMQEEVEQEDVKNKQQIRQHQQQQQQEVPGGQEGAGPVDRGNLEFSFLDTNNICCGLCGEIVVYDKLLTEHLPTAHPEYLSPGVELEEVPYDSWLKTRLKQESKMMENGFRHYDDHDGGGFGGAVRLYSKGIRQMRKVSQIRVNVNEMTLPQLEVALKRKLVEKMGRKVPVSLVDRLHARCDICQAVVSLNKKFEVIHLVRHFNAWHPAEHRCSQDWRDPGSATTSTSRRPLSLSDFSVVSTESADQNNLQCIWCGMMMDRSALGMHFSEVHAQQIAVPNCSLCLQEMVMTARLMEKYGEDFGISLPDEFHLQCSKLNAKYSSEKAMDKAIDRHLKRAKPGVDQHDPDDSHEDAEAICTTNSQQSFGRRNRLKRKFVKPCFRQICPNNSSYFEPKSACEWKCRLCNRNVYGAVISAGAIKHYKEFHPAETEHMQYELVKARLERIGDGSMEFVHPQLVECLICNLTYALHKPFNICRAIRHLRLKHPEVMPETAGKPISGAEISETTDLQTTIRRPNIRFGDTITDPIELERFRKDNFDQQFDKVQIVFGIKKNNEPAYILLMENEKMDLKMAQEMAGKVQTEEDTSQESRFDRLVGRDETPQFEESEPSTMFREETKPMALEFPQQIVEEEVEEMEEVPVETEFIPTYDANNPDHVLIDENEIMNDGNYEMIQEGEYQEIEEDRTVRYLTEDEIREAQARGEILEFEEGEYVEEYAVQQ